MARNYFNRYIWLIDLIQRSGHIPFEDIDRAWQRCSLNPNGDRLSERTFFNHKDAISETFGIEIRCDRSLGYFLAYRLLVDEIHRSSCNWSALSKRNLGVVGRKIL